MDIYEHVQETSAETQKLKEKQRKIKEPSGYARNENCKIKNKQFI